ncbi:aspartate dehydrogenase [Acuticoccus sp. M5D2P5]|uniref:aspartate dehydrogenase n=1 Tax=Acuticoccus kalidii TaxID=2910977 RepID=UPI001F23DD92|nr:aspartate dehydrogenase [Acuticoccus kalidii]MCF3935494.1 aspartate dehydrogenase [Acuticoccus kalidii]
MRRLGLIGYGNIAKTLCGVLAESGHLELDQISILARPGRVEPAIEALRENALRFAAEINVFETVEGFLADGPELVVECATHEAVRTSVPAVLRAGREAVIVSIGALADEAIEAELAAAAKAGLTRAVLVPGAVGGIDALAAAKLSGIESVTYTSRKPPAAWKGTPAEKAVDLDGLTAEAVFFTGDAREAATAYPKNANVAATLALAGAGFAGTKVRLVADPAAPGNIHEYEVRSGAVNFTMRLEGKVSPDNPKTSVSTVYSLAREVLNRVTPFAI